MAQILKSNQDKYVPTSTVNGKASVLVRVAQHGDQLFEERGWNVQWAFGDGANQYDRLEGLRTEFADWHAKFTLYKVNRLCIIFKIIFIATQIEDCTYCTF